MCFKYINKEKIFFWNDSDQEDSNAKGSENNA